MEKTKIVTIQVGEEYCSYCRDYTQHLLDIDGEKVVFRKEPGYFGCPNLAREERIGIEIIPEEAIRLLGKRWNEARRKIEEAKALVSEEEKLIDSVKSLRHQLRQGFSEQIRERQIVKSALDLKKLWESRNAR